MTNTPDGEIAPHTGTPPRQRPRLRATVLNAIRSLLALAGALALCHVAARVSPPPPDLSLLYAGAITAFAATLLTSRLKARSIGKPTRSFFVQGISPGVLRLLALCAILSTVVFLDERIGAHIGLGMVCGSLAGMVAEIVHLSRISTSGSGRPEKDEQKQP